MAPVHFRVLIHLLPPAQGRSPPVLGRVAMVSCDVGTRFRGQPVCHDARVVLDTQPSLQLGSECTARLDPLSSDLWDHVNAGLVFTFYRGRTPLGEAVVLERVAGLLQ